jgi:hypothetical protein
MKKWVSVIQTELDDDPAYQALVVAMKSAGFGIVSIEKADADPVEVDADAYSN